MDSFAVSQESDDLGTDLEYWENRVEREGVEGATIGKKVDTNLWWEKMKPVWSKFKNSSLSLLEYGCGSGRWFPYFSSIGVEYLGVDITGEMLKFAKKKYPGGDFRHLSEFEKGSEFDIVVSITVLQHLSDEDARKAAEFMDNALKRDGYLMLVENTSDLDDKAHVIFRDDWEYRDMFPNIPLELVGDIEYNGNERHSILVGRKE